jgi:hypothetical protein
VKHSSVVPALSTSRQLAHAHAMTWISRSGSSSATLSRTSGVSAAQPALPACPPAGSCCDPHRPSARLRSGQPANAICSAANYFSSVMIGH